ncbi:MAG: tetratricopeptide repeat protein [Polyangiaceae bacterium]|nr:tetratricopeptide repeat protein [Polyangiaceae bacterium]
MFKVNCPGCDAPYQVDERRVPETGLKMRCPKCGTSFQVDSPASGLPTPGSSNALPEPAAPGPGKRAPKPTMMGVAPGIGIPPPRRPAPPKPAQAAPSPEEVYEVASIMPEPDDDLPQAATNVRVPAPARPMGGPPPAPPRAPLGPPPRAPVAVATAEVPKAPAPSARAPAGVLEIDLPSPVPPDPGSPRGSLKPDAGELSLPDFEDAPLPAVAIEKPKVPEKLTSLRPTLGASDAFELDLPVVPVATSKPAGSSAGFGELDLDDVPLPAVVPAPGRSREGELDLPTHAERGGLSLDAQLPSPAENWPRPGLTRSAEGLPSLPMDNSLPSPAQSLPSSLHSLPSPFGGRAGPPASSQPELPEAADALPDFGQLPSLSNRPPPVAQAGRASQPQLGPFESQHDVGRALFGDSGELTFESQPPRASLSNPPFGSAQPTRTGMPSATPGPDSFGEISLPGAESEPPNAEARSPLGAQPVHALGAGPLELDTSGNSNRPPANTSVFSSSAAAARSARVSLGPRVTKGANDAAPAPQRRALKVAAVILTPLFLGGGALTFVPELGPFGYYFVSDKLNEEENRALLASTVKAARAAMARDTFSDGRRAFDLVRAARAQAPREKSFVAYAVFVGFMHKLRFDKAPEIQASAEVLLSELSDSGDIEYADLARAAAASSRDNLARPLNQLRDLQKRQPNNVDVLIMYAEMALRARKEPALAISAWERAQTVEKSARTWFGLARAKHQAGDAKGAEVAAQQALNANPAHAGSKVLLAELLWEGQEKEAQAADWLASVIAPNSGASTEEIVRAHTLLGDIHASRSRISQAEKSYEAALKVNPQDAYALIGLGKTLQQAGRHSEALARFEASNQVDADNLKAQLGIAQSKLSLERLDDAEADLKKLREVHPQEFEVAYWLGRAEDALGHRDVAEKSYREAILLGGGKLRAASAYVGLVTLLNQLGRTAEADQMLSEARKSLPDAPAIRRAFGDLASSAGNYELALAEYRAALALDPKDLGAKFELGVTLRRSRRFADALKVFDEVAVADPDHPGLALERGLLFEESGSRDDALKAYEQALAKAPTDLDVMLRVGCGKAAAGRGKEAVQLLRKVLEARPNSAETSHCMGRALLVEGNNLTDAQRMLQRAVELDPNRAHYHLYVGWVAADVGQADRARASFNKALELDRGFADAYWRRGILLARQGAVKDAVADFTEALRLRPNLYDVHAELADAYYDLGQEAEALAHWGKAVEGRPDEPLWQFRYGRLLVANRQDALAKPHLERAVALAQNADPRPRWLWEAHHMLAQALGLVPAAVEHWEQFLRLSPTDSPYRREAITALERLGRRWDEVP